ncbi:MAG: hypothetical protein CMH26_07170 [Micavibrio sp.]|nr:hypothetical protein [Micavibrio sp.]|tara:strand:+ start:2846 stop:3904 length:1059 start_codon:yes stop_codon:yes gene_type:complete
MSNETDKWFRNAQDRTPGTPGGEEQLYRDEMSKMYENMRGNGGNTPKQQPVQNPKVKSVRKASSGKGGGLIGAFCFAAVVIGVINSCDDKPQYRPKAQEPSTYTAPTSMVNPYKSNQEAEKPQQQSLEREQPTALVNPYKSSGEQKEQPVKHAQPTELVNPYKTNKQADTPKRSGEKIYSFDYPHEAYPIYQETDGFKKGDLTQLHYMHSNDINVLNRMIIRGGRSINDYKAAVANLDIDLKDAELNASLLHFAIAVGFNPISISDGASQADSEKAIKYLLDRGIDSRSYDKDSNNALDLYLALISAPSYKQNARCMDKDLFKRLVPRSGLNSRQHRWLNESKCAKAYNYEF